MKFGGYSSSSSSLCLQRAHVPLTGTLVGKTITTTTCCVSTRDWSSKRTRTASTQKCFSVSYHKFVEFALDETTRHTHLLHSPLQEKYNSIKLEDGKGEISMQSFEAAKIRLLRSFIIETETMQVLDFTVYPKAEYDVPIFCANFFTTARTNIVVLDLNPLHDIINGCDYKEKYFNSLIPLGLKYAEHFPWGGKLTSESIKFFSPIVIWTRFSSHSQKYDTLYSAFKDYYKVWLELISKGIKETDESQISRNLEAQHRYLTWRAEKDPGQGILKKLIGDRHAKDLLRGFLFNGVDELGSKTFYDYFTQYCPEHEGNDLSTKGSVSWKSFDNRPWNEKGEFIGNNQL